MTYKCWRRSVKRFPGGSGSLWGPHTSSEGWEAALREVRRAREGQYFFLLFSLKIADFQGTTWRVYNLLPATETLWCLPYAWHVPCGGKGREEHLGSNYTPIDGAGKEWEIVPGGLPFQVLLRWQAGKVMGTSAGRSHAQNMLLETLAKGVVACQGEATRGRSRLRHLEPENKLVYARFGDQSSKNLAVLSPILSSLP